MKFTYQTYEVLFNIHHILFFPSCRPFYLKVCRYNLCHPNQPDVHQLGNSVLDKNVLDPCAIIQYNNMITKIHVKRARSVNKTVSHWMNKIASLCKDVKTLPFDLVQMAANCAIYARIQLSQTQMQQPRRNGNVSIYSTSEGKRCTTERLTSNRYVQKL